MTPWLVRCVTCVLASRQLARTRIRAVSIFELLWPGTQRHRRPSYHVGPSVLRGPRTSDFQSFILVLGVTIAHWPLASAAVRHSGSTARTCTPVPTAPGNANTTLLEMHGSNSVGPPTGMLRRNSRCALERVSYIELTLQQQPRMAHSGLWTFRSLPHSGPEQGVHQHLERSHLERSANAKASRYLPAGARRLPGGHTLVPVIHSADQPWMCLKALKLLQTLLQQASVPTAPASPEARTAKTVKTIMKATPLKHNSRSS